MDMAAAAKRIRSGDVMRALDSGEFDDIVVPELDDSCSDGEEPVTSDVVINGDAKLDICDVVRQSSSNHLDPCFRESVLLDDVELDNSSDVSDIENDSNLAGTHQEESAEVPRVVASSTSEKQGQNRRPLSVISGSTRSRPQLPVWNSTFQNIQPLHFVEVPGPSRTVHRCQTVLDFFMLFFTTVVWNLLVVQTNLYYSQRIADKPSSMEWADVTVEEMMAFIGLVIAMGVVRLPEIDDYWATDPILQHPWFASIMSRTRFKQILRYLHCADNTANVVGDKLRKLRNIVDMLNVSSRQMYTPSQCLSVDESMVGTKCRISFLQYMPKKTKEIWYKVVGFV